MDVFNFLGCDVNGKIAGMDENGFNRINGYCGLSRSFCNLADLLGEPQTVIKIWLQEK